MTSASNPPAVLDTDRIDATAERIAIDWGHYGHSTITAIITEIYAELAYFPVHFAPQQRDAIITDAADTTASELTTLLDDHIYQEADQPPVTEYGWVMHTDDRHTAVAAALASHITWWLTEQLNDFIADRDAASGDD
ncbi:hypothetical protein [Mycolicibacterium cosmeticum]|jgi:hypothetical protein|uniref:hypothetical protein n=1 Tax=Mycolicibacterium cosmeticum TaxID=258533 RepID=UPI003204D4CD